MILAALVDSEALLKVILYSLVTTLGLTTVFSVGIVGMTRYDERRRAGQGGLGWALMALVSGLLVAGFVIEAIIVMANK